jgi:hypothetical protein
VVLRRRQARALRGVDLERLRRAEARAEALSAQTHAAPSSLEVLRAAFVSGMKGAAMPARACRPPFATVRLPRPGLGPTVADSSDVRDRRCGARRDARHPGRDRACSRVDRKPVEVVFDERRRRGWGRLPPRPTGARPGDRPCRSNAPAPTLAFGACILKRADRDAAGGRARHAAGRERAEAVAAPSLFEDRNHRLEGDVATCARRFLVAADARRAWGRRHAVPRRAGCSASRSWPATGRPSPSWPTRAALILDSGAATGLGWATTWPRWKVARLLLAAGRHLTSSSTGAARRRELGRWSRRTDCRPGPNEPR